LHGFLSKDLGQVDMAHFCEIDETNAVLRTIVISNADIVDSNGIEQEQLGIELCNQIAGFGRWIQTSYNNNFRKMFATPGMKYAGDADVFYNPVGPYPSWVLDANYDWQPPTPKPNDGKEHWWDEENSTWVEVVLPEE
jgi:hypothetical protein